MEQTDEIHYIERIKEGETELFSVFLDRYSRPLYSLMVQIVGCPEDTEELLQDVFLKAFRNLNNYKAESSFSTWIYRIAYNVAVSATRKKKQEFLCMEESMIDNVPDEKVEAMIDGVTDDEEKLMLLSKAIDLLDVEERTLITLFYYETKSVEEVSKIMEISVNNAKVKLHRTRRKLYILMNGK